MARQKEFDRDEVLHKAMEVFWTRGYEGTSIQDLVKHMGINRQSIYDTFGDKHSLFLQALDRDEAAWSVTRCLNWQVAAKRPLPEPVTAWPRRRKCSRGPCKKEKSRVNCGVFGTRGRWPAFFIAIFRGCS